MNDASPSADDPSATQNAGDRDAALREALSEVYHDLNNALAVVAGNAQLLAELARADDLGAAFTDPLDDIQTAYDDMSEALERLDDLREARQNAAVPPNRSSSDSASGPSASREEEGR